jgi:2-dehydro-3-deoxyphosphogluconate aldolase/(4S)-4-hydroxy-2-oxoglutarate aldolase
MPLLEITLNTPGALEGIAKVRQELGDVVIGAGTILCPADARAAIDAGAQFIVTPTLQLDTIAACRQRQVPIMCGAMTPTEILAAHSAGADYVKLFPAGSLGLEYIKAVLAPLPFVKIVPTGGVSLANLADFLRVCPAVGVGGNLVDLKLISQGRWDELMAVARQFAQAAATVKGVAR